MHTVYTPGEPPITVTMTEDEAIAIAHALCYITESKVCTRTKLTKQEIVQTLIMFRDSLNDDSWWL